MYRQYYLWLFGSLAISIGLQLLLPYPYGFIAALGVFIMIPLFQRYKVRGVFKLERGFTKRCGVCGAKSSDRQCGRCGSRQFRMG